MLCEKCQNLSFRDSATATGYARARDFAGAHQVEGKWLPGNSREVLESWCAKNCKPAKPAKPAKPVELVKEVKEVKEEITPSSPLKDKWVQSSNKSATDKKKD